MRKLLILTLLVLSATAALPGNTNSFKFSNNWTVNYSIYNSVLYVEASGTNNGAVAIGLGGTKMSQIDVAHAYIDANNAPQIADRNYINPVAVPNKRVVDLDTARDPAGTSDYTDNGSTYNTATYAWKVSFKRNLDTKDQYDVVITDGSAIQVSIALFDGFTWGGKHTSALYQTVTLSSAATTSTSSSGILSLAFGLIASLLCLF